MNTIKITLLTCIFMPAIAACGSPTDAFGGFGGLNGVDSNCAEYVDTMITSCTEYRNYPYDCKEFADNINAQLAGTGGMAVTNYRTTEKVSQCPTGAVSCCEFEMLGASGRIYVYNDSDACTSSPSLAGSGVNMETCTPR